MGTWNYRIIRHHDCLMLHEVHYDDAGKVRAYTADPATFVADHEEGLTGITDALQMAWNDATSRPVLDVADLPKGDEPDPRDPIVRHEALDRASLLAGVVERELLDHPAVQGDPAVLSAVKRAVAALGEAYQAAGQDVAG